ncbi:tyrosine-type recombinase/integrase (plasmid) [Mesorhizobium sp. AR07]|uniref:tyrosine-type recombinase/integrase n=1 Tax=Mesorhizobium sp. AR07 TaxID=2865838 RepID=UPI00215F37D5|nr:tyrosine-type recombinase/integrase [Mesorhizobium sp. AR07]UVK48699.1 tyrosine-type recombinase/integrase [Mesorhizobium sp. AR07]UVK48727.1 tyrosine-type recombinase/integrase [Mesorhizobium sp. AR07]
MPETLHLTPLNRRIDEWLAHQRALGRAYDNEERILQHLRRVIVSSEAGDLDQKGFDRWCASLRHLSPTTRRCRQLVVRKFCLFRRRAEPGCFVPDPLYFARQLPYRRPVILEPAQVSRMLAAADSLAPTTNSPLLPAVMRLATIILYTAGLRRGELARLTLDDVEPQSGLLRIRESKFHKSRLVPLSPDAAGALHSYLHLRLAPPFSAYPSSALLCCGRAGQHGYTGAGLGQAINRLFVTADVRDSEGRLPRVHDIRHSFGVQALIRWYRAGADVQSCLPSLAIYMGHVSIVSTAHYLHFVPTMRELASSRFEAAFGNIVAGAKP